MATLQQARVSHHFSNGICLLHVSVSHFGNSHNLFIQFSSVQSLSHVRLFVTPMNRSTPGLPVHHQLPDFTQTHVHRVGEREGQQRFGKSLFLKNQFWPSFTEWRICMWLLPGEKQFTWYSEEWNSIRKSFHELFSSLLACNVIMYFRQIEFASVQLTGLHEF